MMMCLTFDLFFSAFDQLKKSYDGAIRIAL
jgi:hypothetical protein